MSVPFYILNNNIQRVLISQHPQQHLLFVIVFIIKVVLNRSHKSVIQVASSSKFWCTSTALLFLAKYVSRGLNAFKLKEKSVIYKERFLRIHLTALWGTFM